ncbi:MAG: DsbA family protein [Candidatus Harrisonbacteria bacterium]|nr:DsbA family protein [Candidatus Harrisonbacteria bacterium]
MKRVAIWSFAIAIVGLALFGLIKLGINSAPNQSASLIDAVSPKDWGKGAEEAKVVLVEYSDFQCPACGAYYPLLKRLSQEFTGQIKFVYRHFPLSQIHANAEPAARAAEASGKQGKFWEMHDLIFENQTNWSNQKNAEVAFISYAQSLQLDIERFKTDLNSQEVKESVANDYQSGIRSKVNGTPTFFLNGQKIQNPRSYDEFKNIIEQAINANL